MANERETPLSVSFFREIFAEEAIFMSRSPVVAKLGVSEPLSSPPSPAPADPDGKLLEALGVYGFGQLEPLLLASLVTEDPILLIGHCGTGKTFLLNSLSEALGLSHRHYNASLISFDDLVGFPYPDEQKATVRFLETPATIWGAESVLVDEISRCKPEHQNRLFSLVHERRVQGIALDSLRYRWAAMNPPGVAGGMDEDYLGSEPLDAALADRFSMILEVGDWPQLTEDEQRRVANPSGEGAISDLSPSLAERVAQWRQHFDTAVTQCPEWIVDYSCSFVSALAQGGIRLSPRRSRLLARTLLALTIVTGKRDAGMIQRAVSWSLPQRAWGEPPGEDKLAAAHRLAWDVSTAAPVDRWIHQFHLERDLGAKARCLVELCPSPDAASIAIEQLIAHEPPARSAAFAFAAYPAALEGRISVGAEALQDLGRLAAPVISVDGDIHWQQRRGDQDQVHPDLVRVTRVLEHRSGARSERAKQLLYWCLVQEQLPENPWAFEVEFHRAFEVFSQHTPAGEKEASHACA